MKLLIITFLLLSPYLHSQKIMNVIDISDLSSTLKDELIKFDSTRQNNLSDIELFEKIENEKYLQTKLDSAKYYFFKGNLFRRFSDIKSSLSMYDKAIEIISKIDTLTLLIIYNYKASIYNQISDYENALLNYYKSIDMKFNQN